MDSFLSSEYCFFFKMRLSIKKVTRLLELIPTLGFALFSIIIIRTPNSSILSFTLPTNPQGTVYTSYESVCLQFHRS